MGKTLPGKSPLLPDLTINRQHRIIQSKLIKAHCNIHKITSRNPPWGTICLRGFHKNTERGRVVDLPPGAILSPFFVVGRPAEERSVSVAGVGILGEDVAENIIDQAAVDFRLVYELAALKHYGRVGDVVVVEATGNVTGREAELLGVSLEVCIY